MVAGQDRHNGFLIVLFNAEKTVYDWRRSAFVRRLYDSL